ncbi:phenylacetic acid degradation bifunctional protein PaaZ [Roseivivax sp.]
MRDDITGPRRLESYLAGDWRQGQGAARPLHHAATGEVVAEIGAEGLDLGEALAWGRDQGGAALRAQTLHERALMLKEIGLRLMEMKEVFYQENFWTGATRKDGWIDIDGGIGTLLTFASRARREFPNARVIPEGPVEPLSGDDSFSAQHILTPRQGVAVHINAFNFPVWGMLEKIAPSLIAGMPCLVKPASQTAYLTERVVRAILEMEILPEGALQLLAGGAGDLLDHLDVQDVVTFTGSAATGQKLRAHPAVVANSVPFTMEADSLNAAILGPDAGPESPEFDLFVREVAREMSVKAGQKCTAIRRVIVPRAREEALAQALSERLSRLAIGLPEDEATRIGALVSLGDREGVRAQVAALRAEAEIVSGDPERVELASGSAETGAFMSPILLRARDPMGAHAVHDIEAFGPVATLMAYDTPEEAVALAAKGKGSLVSSLFTADPGVAAEVVTGLAPHHGRVLIGSRHSAKSSTGHGSPLAPLVHGGPGRAGGGEEMGGMRGVKHFMMRTAVQGAPELLSAVTGEWAPGAPTRDDVHPFRRPLSELRLGDRISAGPRQISRADVEHFAEFTGDTFYAHMDSAAARENPFFDDRVAHGYLIVSFAAGLFVEPNPGPVLANYGVDNLRFLTPVYFGDALSVTLSCKAINPRAGADHGEVRWAARVVNQNDELVADYEVLTMVAKDWPPA